MEDDAGAASSASVARLALALLVSVSALAVLVRGRWRRAAARREEVRRLVRMAAEESELAERESALAYSSELFPGVVHAAELPEAPVWEPSPPVTAVAPSPAQADVEAPQQPPPAAGAKGVCAVCFWPTTFRCKQCKAVKYCSFKCQIAHWRQGHKDECCPPSVNTGSDDGDVKDGRTSGGNVLVGVKPVLGSETSGPNHSLTTLNEKNKHLEEICTRTEIPGDNHSNGKVEISQIARPNTSKNCGSTTEATDETLPCNSQPSAQKINSPSAIDSEEAFGLRAQNGIVIKEYSSHNRKIADNNNPQAAASGCVLWPESSKTPVPVEVEKSKTKPVVDDIIQMTKLMPSASTDNKGSSIHSGCLVTPNPLKRADNLPEIILKTSMRAGSAATSQSSLASSLMKIVKQQTATKVVRHYPSESTIFPYEHFVKLYDKVDLQPFGLHNLGNSCYANAVLQCLMFTRPLTSYLLGRLHSKNCSKKKWCFMCEFEKLVVEGKQVRTALSPTGILSHLHDIGSSFGPGKQEDAHEFLRYAIDAMQSVCLKEARKGAAHLLAEETTLVQLIFGGYLRSKIRCSRCNVSSEHSERILDLTVEIDGDISSLEEALERFTSTEVLDGENKYQCSSCKSYERAKKKLLISEAPNVLTIALKRYQSGKFGKISKAIRFPETLNLARYMSTKDDCSPVYSLYAVVVHNDVMNAAFSGHYVCYVKDTQGKWYKADDSQVKPTSLEHVMSKCAYMLLYARCSPRAPSSVRQAMMVRDPARVKKGKSKVVLEGTTLNGGGSLSRHQGVQLQRTNGIPHRFDDYGDASYPPAESPGVQLQMTNGIPHRFDDYGDASYPPAESPSPSESSSLFSNSDAGSHSTDSSDSTRNSTSTEDYEYLIFGNSDQMYPEGPMAASENDYAAYSRSRSCLNTSPSGREAGDAGRYTEHKLQGTRGSWVEGGEGSSFLYTDSSRQHLSSKLTERCRQLDGTGHDPGETRGSNLSRRRSAREKTTQTSY